MKTNLIHKLRKLYRENPLCVSDFESYIPIDEISKKLRENPPKDFKISTLDKYEYSRELFTTLVNLPAEVVLHEFGEDIAKVTPLGYIYYNEGQKFMQDLENKLEENPGNLERSRLATWTNNFKTNSNLILKTNHLLNFTQKKFVENYDLRKHIGKNGESIGNNISESRLNKYSLTFFETRNNLECGKEKSWYKIDYNNLRAWDVFLDSPIAIGLLYENRPSLTISVIPKSTKTLLIKQIQGENEKKLRKLNSLEFENTGKVGNRGVVVFEYKKFAVEMCEELAKQTNFRRIGIQGAKNNKWTKEKYENGKIHLDYNSAEKIYDRTAERMNYQKNRDGNWYKNLK